ncbi:MAG: DUF1249 domain-containing protein [Woeseiaceae bacterium]|nr:DUF1249 domain-containing protein [Woeseiaceae bacterium]
MLLDSQLVPQTIVKPKSFVGLMALYESNYLRLRQLIPEIDQLDGCYRSRVAGDCDLHVDILERCRYTVTLSLTYRFNDGMERVADPDMAVRVYLDGRLAEAICLCERLETRWKRNIVLNKWLEYLTDQGHLILERL